MTASSTMADQIAAVIEAWAKDQPRWMPVPTNDEIAAQLPFAASRTTFLAAKKHLARQGVLVMAGRGFYVAAPAGSAARTNATGGQP
jgi:DNA-binding GntR family transcriptional regulator